MDNLRTVAESSKAWPFQEARRLVKRYARSAPEKGYVLFETGYGPSGLPHIGTFGEVARTTMVRRAFEVLCDIPTRLICFSDDLDGLRKVPGNIENQATLAEDLFLPLTKVRDPFGTHNSFGEHNNARLCTFLDAFGFEYEFVSSTQYYQSGRFDEKLLLVLENFEKIQEIMLPSLGKERQETYSPFLPISPKSGHVLQVPTLERDVANGTITYREPDGELVTLPVTGGNVKLQWKPDWAMRWAALGVDYEMFGKDLIPSAELGGRLCRVLGERPPELFNYELFNDEHGQKISKSKGNGISLEQWLNYASPESLSLFMFQKPKTAKRLYLDIIPKTMDEYHQHLRSIGDQTADQRLSNPAWHIHQGKVPPSDMVVPFSMLLNLASAANAEDKSVLWGFIKKYAPDASAESHPGLDAAADYAVRYFIDEVKPGKEYRAPDAREEAALADLRDRLQAWDQPVDAAELQSLVFAVGKEHGFEPLRAWFSAIYEVLLGAKQGPRFGGFIALYGVQETIDLIGSALEGQLCSVE